jgi:hypothetical protein
MPTAVLSFAGSKRMVRALASVNTAKSAEDPFASQTPGVLQRGACVMDGYFVHFTSAHF